MKDTKCSLITLLGFLHPTLDYTQFSLVSLYWLMRERERESYKTSYVQGQILTQKSPCQQNVTKAFLLALRWFDNLMEGVKGGRMDKRKNTHTHTHIYIEPTNFSFSFLRKNLPNINLLKLANFKNPHTYIYIYAICQISMYSTYQLKKST